MQRDRVSAGTDPATPAAVPLADYTSPPLRPPDCLHNAYGLKKSRPAKFGLCAWPEPVRPRAHPRGRTRARPCAAAPARPCAAAGTRAHNAHARGRPCAGAGTRPCAAARTRTRALACLRARGTVPAPTQGATASLAGLVAVLVAGTLRAPLAAQLALGPRLGPGNDARPAVMPADAKPSHGEAAAMGAGRGRPWRSDPRPLAGHGEGKREL